MRPDQTAKPLIGDERAGWPRRRTIITCFLAQNLTSGLAFGTFGPLLHSNELHFGVGRGAAASGMSAVTLAIGLLSPFAGGFLQRVSIRTAMAVGVGLSAIGYCALTFATSFPLAIAAYLMIGCGVSLSGILGPVTLIGRWYERSRGRILALVNLPLILFVSPYLVAETLPFVGRSGVLLAMSALLFVLLPLLAAIAEHPPEREFQEISAEATRVAGRSRLLRSAPFWLTSLGLGVIAGCISAFLVHIVPFGLERSMSLPKASAMISAYALAGMFGILLFGWIADRIGAVRALVLSATLQAILWLVLLIVGGDMFLPVAALLGICAAPQPTLHGAAMTALFGPEAVRAMGLSFALKLPFLFGFPPAVGALYDWSGDYRAPFMFCSGSLMLAAALFGASLMTVRNKRQRGNTA